MSLCDKCFDPGRCCKLMNLSQKSGDALTVWTDIDIPAQAIEHGLPFEPVAKLGEWTDEKTGRPYAEFHWRCTKLLPNGRCGIYEDRPNLCRSFEPLTDQLCVHWNGAETGE